MSKSRLMVFRLCGRLFDSALCCALTLGMLLAIAGVIPPAHAGPAVVLTLDGAVSPATADYVVRGIKRAEDKGAEVVVLVIDTPGGLDTSMRRIVKAILASPVPVVTFVSPGGARAASAGTFILYASHVAAMAPATNLGAATPVRIGGGGSAPEPRKPAEKSKAKQGDDAQEARKDTAAPKDAMSNKQVHDASAYIRSLAQLRGRNAEWGESAVREAVSLSADEARKLKVIEVVAADVDDLLKQIHGTKVTVAGTQRTLDTQRSEKLAIEPDWRSEVLAVIADPNVALILMMIGIYGLIFEFSHPGFVLPGVVGAICLLLALYALQLLPINYAGLGLILLGLAFIVAEAFLPSFGALGIGGTAALVIGAVILFDPETAAGYSISIPFVVTLALVSAGIVFAISMLALRARRRPIVSGRENIIGQPGLVLDDMQTEGWARVQGEQWRVVSRTPLSRNEKVRVTGIDGLTLTVEPER